MNVIKKRMSISTQLTVLVIIALLLSTICFSTMHSLSNHFIAMYLHETKYVETVANKYLDDFEKYIDENNVRSTDKETLDAWVNAQKILYLEIYNKYIDDYVYISNKPSSGTSMDSDAWAANEAYERPVKFHDGERSLWIYGNYTYKFFYYALAAELLTSFVIFFLILMYILRKRIAELKNFKNEIEILEGGNLEYELTLIGGNNELTELSISIENLRKSILEQFGKEEHLKRINNCIISDLSHDIRTPLTTLVIYTDAIKYKKYQSEEELQQYILKIEHKLEQMKHLTDTILEYSLETLSEHCEKCTKDSFAHILSDRLSGFIECLEQSGIITVTNVEMYGDIISVYENDLDRILDNILSNIMKYADKSYPVIITSDKAEAIELSFENRKSQSLVAVSGHKLGINNIRKMITKMGCDLRIENTETKFKIILIFNQTSL